MYHINFSTWVKVIKYFILIQIKVFAKCNLFPNATTLLWLILWPIKSIWDVSLPVMLLQTRFTPIEGDGV